MERPVKFTYRPHVTYSRDKPAIPHDWRSHGCIGISTNDHATAARWRAMALAAGYVEVREAVQFRALCAAQQQRARAKLPNAMRKQAYLRRCRGELAAEEKHKRNRS